MIVVTYGAFYLQIGIVHCLTNFRVANSAGDGESW